MKNNEAIASDLSPCVRIFIESLLKAELPDTTPATGATDNSVDIKKVSRSATPSEMKSM